MLSQITIRKLIICITLLFLSNGTVFAEEPVDETSYIIKNIRIIDGDGDKGIHDVLIKGDRIAAIDPNQPPENLALYDGSGKSMLPGLIDAHVHITMIPGEPYLQDSADQRKQRHAMDLRSYLAWGVTSIVDPGITPEDVQLIKDISSTSPAPELYVIGPLLGPSHGYPSVVTKLNGVSSLEELQQKMDEFQPLNPLGLKVTMENGHYGEIWPLFTEEMQKIIQQEAKQRNSKLYIHAMDAKMTRKALQMHPHALVHASKNGGQKLAKELKTADVYVVTTLDIYGSLLLIWNKDMLYPNTSFTTPKEAIDLIYDKQIQKRIRTTKRFFPHPQYTLQTKKPQFLH